MLLGTYHFGGNTPDKNKAIDDMMSQKRQAEIEAVLEDLAKFNPQQIMIEYTPRYDSVINKMYQAYCNENTVPKQKSFAESETFQIAMRLGKLLKVPRITPVDFAEREDTVSAIAALNWSYRKKLGQYFGDLVKPGDYGISLLNDIRQSQTKFLTDTIPVIPVREALLRLNTNQWQQDAMYTGKLAFMDKNPANMGAELAEMTMFRDFHIFSNIINAVTAKTERILLVIGASHVGVLTNWFRSHPSFEVVPVANYL